MTEQWVRWEPIPNLSNKYYIQQINDNHKGFEIILLEEGQTYKKTYVRFKDSVVAYENTDETFTLRILDKNAHLYEQGFFSKWTFFKIINSSFIQARPLVLDDNANDHSLTHFVIYTEESILDIIADYEPEIAIIHWDRGTLLLCYKEIILPLITQYFPDATIILYDFQSEKELLDINIALDNKEPVKAASLEALKESLENANIAAHCNVIDFYAIPKELQQQISQTGIDWKKAQII